MEQLGVKQQELSALEDKILAANAEKKSLSDAEDFDGAGAKKREVDALQASKEALEKDKDILQGKIEDAAEATAAEEVKRAPPLSKAPRALKCVSFSLVQQRGLGL